MQPEIGLPNRARWLSLAAPRSFPMSKGCSKSGARLIWIMHPVSDESCVGHRQLTKSSVFLVSLNLMRCRTVSRSSDTTSVAGCFRAKVSRGCCWPHHHPTLACVGQHPLVPQQRREHRHAVVVVKPCGHVVVEDQRPHSPKAHHDHRWVCHVMQAVDAKTDEQLLADKPAFTQREKRKPRGGWEQVMMNIQKRITCHGQSY